MFLCRLCGSGNGDVVHSRGKFPQPSQMQPAGGRRYPFGNCKQYWLDRASAVYSGVVYFDNSFRLNCLFYGQRLALVGAESLVENQESILNDIQETATKQSLLFLFSEGRAFHFLRIFIKIDNYSFIHKIFTIYEKIFIKK